MHTSPENCADELNRIARILILDGSGNVEPITMEERAIYNKRLDQLLSSNVTFVAVLCITEQTRQFLSGYTQGVPELSNLYAYLRNNII